MRARDHTSRMLAWWAAGGVDRADLAARQMDGVMIRHLDLPLDKLPLAWAGATNVRGADIFVRPARGHSWSLVFLDDVAEALARRIAGKYAALVVHTSAEGGCHVWLRCDRSLDEPQRRAAQRWLAEQCSADYSSTSGEHFGRLAGFRNHKRDGTWVNVLAASAQPAWTVCHTAATGTPAARPRDYSERNGPDRTPSGRDWAWACAALESGCAPADVVDWLTESARDRRGLRARGYAERTVRKAAARAQAR